MLEYIDNVDYSRPKERTPDDLAQELRELASLDEDVAEIYDALREEIYRDIHLTDLAIVHIAPDLLALVARSPKRAMIILRLLAEPLASYSEIGRESGCSKQRVHAVVRDASRSCPWLARLVEIRNR